MTTDKQASGAPATILAQAGVVNVPEALKSHAKADAVAFARGERAVMDVVQETARHLGTAPTYHQWEIYREAWQEACPLDAPDKAWHRLAKMLKDFHGLEKPSSKAAKAQTVSAERKAEQAKIDLLVARPRAELQQAAKAAVDKGDAESLKNLQRIQKAMKQQTREEVKDAIAAFSTGKKDARARISALKFNGVHKGILEKVMAILPPVPVKEESEDDAEDGEF
jgi:hypothetical protein